MVGAPPFFAGDREELFEKIKKGVFKIPSTMSVEARDLIKSLLTKDYKKRLGAIRDGEEIREASFFKTIDWNMVYNKKYDLPKPVLNSMPKQQLSL